MGFVRIILKEHNPIISEIEIVMTSHFSNLSESFSHRNHSYAGHPRFHRLKLRALPWKNKQTRTKFYNFLLGTSACSPNLVHSLHAVICAKQHCCVELWEISESEDNSKMLHCQETSTGLLMVHLWSPFWLFQSSKGKYWYW